MRIDATTLVFFDASCLGAASGRPEGGAGYVLSLCVDGSLRAAVSHPVLIEAERTIRAEFRPVALTTYHRMLAEAATIVVAVPDAADREDYRQIVGDKDDHVVAAAIAGKAPFLLILDKRLARGLNGVGLPIRALSSGEFINEVLPDHADADSLRR